MVVMTITHSHGSHQLLILLYAGSPTRHLDSADSFDPRDHPIKPVQ